MRQATTAAATTSRQAARATYTSTAAPTAAVAHTTATQSCRTQATRVGTHSSSRRSSLITCFISCHTFSTALLLLLCLLLAGTAQAATKLTSRSSNGSNNTTTTSTGAGQATAAGAQQQATPVWDHAIDLNEDFRILWQIINQDITFEIQARTLGYVGFGFSPDGNVAGADMAIGWVDKGQTYFQVSDKIKKIRGNPKTQREKPYTQQKGSFFFCLDHFSFSSGYIFIFQCVQPEIKAALN